jgi:YbbR domain-containing protein
LILKITSLILALLTWGYISSELYKESLAKGKEAPSIINISGEKMVAKMLPIYVDIDGEPADGYRLMLDKVLINPSSSVVIGPPEIVRDLSYIATKAVDIKGKDTTITESIELSPIPNVKIGYGGLVKITVPIAKIRHR